MAEHVKSQLKQDVGRNTKADIRIDTCVLEKKLGYLVRLLDRKAGRDVALAAGMTPVQYSVFALVANNEGMPQGAIGEALNMDRASTMAVMDKLERAGLIERRKSMIDRRMHALFVTEAGHKVYGELEASVAASDDAYKNKLTEDELDKFLGCLKKLLR